jgi:hypothetical protein
VNPFVEKPESLRDVLNESLKRSFEGASGKRRRNEIIVTFTRVLSPAS